VPRQACTTCRFSSTPVFQNAMAWQACTPFFQKTQAMPFLPKTHSQKRRGTGQQRRQSQQVKRRPGRAGCHHDVVTCEDTVRWGQSDGEGVQTTACMILFIIHEAKSKNGNVSTTYYIILIVCGPFIRHCYAQGRM
jgi:hypothetical protein